MNGAVQRSQWQSFAFGAAVVAVTAAIASGRLPRWLRIVLVLGFVILACGAGFYAYRYATQPTTLTIAAGSLDGDAPRIMSEIATRLASTGGSVRLKVIDKGNVAEATKAFSAGETDLAIVRSDVGDLSNAKTVLVVTHAAVLLVAPPSSSITGGDDLKGKTVGVVGGEANKKLVGALTREYDLERLQVHFKDLTIADMAQVS